jgi:Protein of unknown function (DUF2911)
MNRNMMTMVLAAGMLVASMAAAERADDTDRASKNGRTEGEIDGIGIVLEYGRPSVKERTIWGGLVPYGQVWRTGADEATTITLSSDAKVEGEMLPAGTYALFTVPGESEWTVIFNKTAEQWGAFRYDESQDALRVSVTPETGEHVESLDFVVEDGSVVLRWDQLRVPIAVSAG